MIIAKTAFIVYIVWTIPKDFFLFRDDIRGMSEIIVKILLEQFFFQPYRIRSSKVTPKNVQINVFRLPIYSHKI